MRRIFVLIVCLSVALSALGQIKKTDRLIEKISDSGKDFIKIRVEFKEYIDFAELKSQFNAQKLNPDKRARVVISKLKAQANTSQEALLHLLEYRNGWCKNITPFWINNIVILEAKKELIEEIQTIDNVSRIDYHNEFIQMHDEIIQGSGGREPGGTEPGLIAINAPAMWKLGYTGRGRMVYDYDTGVWPTHPAFADRFIGNRFPMGQSWYPYKSESPSGQISDHGTHTLGTMAGLVESTNDTLGVAYRAYWTANDYVASTVEELPPLEKMIEAFEWALNPDGNDSTTFDIPDVINNSWRWRDSADTVECSGYIVDLMNAIEAAGIANVFSGGNSGPSNTTVNSPQRINTSEVNTFSVGSIDANQAQPYPISSFSTRGPTQCSGTGSLKIHPQVVAPGQNVRSAWSSNEYNTISGTSMAAPHVSGAVLLLKEAFPDITGEDILWALYNTASDMGVAGEDNTYGRGLIDVYKAYQYLDSLYTPVDPFSIKYDIALDNITEPENAIFSCDQYFTPTVTLINKGDTTVNNIDLKCYFKNDASTFVTATYTGTLASDSSTTLSLDSLEASSYGEQELICEISYDSSVLDHDIYNNFGISRFHRTAQYNLPFNEDFESGLESNFWYIENPDNSVAWDTITTLDTKKGMAAVLKSYDYDPDSGQLDGLISSRIQLSNYDTITMTFDLAYQLLHESVTEKLEIYVSTDCGQTYDNALYSKTTSELSTYDTIIANFNPQKDGHWRTESVDLSNYKGQEINLKFEVTNGSGNNLYIDNINLFEGSYTSVRENSPNQLNVKVFPNPSKGIFNLINEEGMSLQYEVYNLLGEKIEQGHFSGINKTLQLEKYPASAYFLKLNHENTSIVLKLLKN